MDAEPVLYLERGGKGVLTLGDDPLDSAGEPTGWLREALRALADHVHRGRLKRLALERFDGEPVIGSAYGALLIELGFRQSPRKLTLSA